MKYDPAIHKRRSIRLTGYDYSQMGLYFITSCVHNKELLFGEIQNDQMILNAAGQMIQTEWEKLPQRFSNIQLHDFVVMPNHFHGILEIVGDINNPAPNVGATLVVAPDDIVAADRLLSSNTIAPDDGRNKNDAPHGKTIGDMMMAFKSTTTVEYIRGVKQSGWQPFNRKLWQRNYYEHIIRNEQAYQTIAGYVIENPSRWIQDKFYKK